MSNKHTKVYLVLTDINECELGVSTCHESATCSDVVGGAGSFSCNCVPGYIGNGTTCTGELTVYFYNISCWYTQNICKQILPWDLKDPSSPKEEFGRGPC